MRLTVLLVALALFVLVAEPAAVMARALEGHSLGSADPHGLPAASGVHSTSEPYQPGSEGYQGISSENLPASEEYPDISGECAPAPEERAASQESPRISREYQPISGEYSRISQEYQSMSREYISISEEYATLKASPASDVQDLSLPRGQSPLDFIASALGRGGSALVSSIPALLLSVAGALGAACFSCLSLPALPCSLPLGMILACAGAVVFGALGLFAGPFFGAIAGLILGPIVLFFLSGVCGFSCGATIGSCAALFCSELFAVCYGGNTATCVIWWFLLVVWLVLSWVWITFGGFGWAMIGFACISVPCTSIIGFFSTIFSACPFCACYGWLPNTLWLAILILAFGIVMVLFFIIFDLLYSIVLSTVNCITSMLGYSIAFVYDLFDIFSGILYLIFDVFCYMPISLCIYCTALCATIPGTIVGWILQCFLVAPAISAVAGLFSGLACTILFTVVNLLLGIVLGPLLGCLAGCLTGPVAGAAFGCASGFLASCLIPLITMAAAAMSGCGSMLSLVSCLAEATGTSDALLSLLVFLRDSISSAVRLILGILVGAALSLLKFLDGCLALADTYCNLTDTFFEMCYNVLAVCAPIGIISPCCVVSCGSVLGILCTFCAQILWNVLYHLTDSFRSCSSCALGVLEAMNGRLIM